MAHKRTTCAKSDIAFQGEPVVAVLDNLLPDPDALRKRVAGRVGAAGIDAYSLLTAIGRDCVGALRFVSGHDDDQKHDHVISGDSPKGFPEAIHASVKAAVPRRVRALRTI